MTKFLGFRFTLRRFGLVALALLLFGTRLKGNFLFNIIKLPPTPQNGIYLGHGQFQTGDFTENVFEAKRNPELTLNIFYGRRPPIINVYNFCILIYTHKELKMLFTQNIVFF